MWRRFVSIALVAAILAILAIATLAAATQARPTLETPVYSVVSQQDGFEIRRYAPRLVAEVVVAGEVNPATRTGFQILANFIKGNNTTQTRIAMTEPFDRRMVGNHAWVVAFTMPSKYSLATLPEPCDPRVRIRELPVTTYAVLRFSGAPRESVVQARMHEFVHTLEVTGFEPGEEPPIYARYDPPWTLGFLRRNEIFVELD